VESLKGKFLLASPTLLDPNFAKSVVLIVRHDDDGAFGLVVNRPLSVTVAQAIGEHIAAAAQCESPLHSGGPCEGPVFMLHRDAVIGGDEPITNVFCTTDRDAIEAIVAAPDKPSKIFGSYAGWSPSQLEAELAENAWVVCPAKAEDVFNDDPALWKALHTRAHLSRYVDRVPDDPSVN
jgi:putative transcriptional regulator